MMEANGLTLQTDFDDAIYRTMAAIGNEPIVTCKPTANSAPERCCDRAVLKANWAEGLAD